MKIQSLIFLALVIFSCKQNNSGSGSDTNGNTPIETYFLLNQAEVTDVDLQKMRAEAIKILDHRQKESNNKVITILEKGVFEFNAVVLSSVMSVGDSIAGEWIDFKDDLTYDYGRYDKVNGSGRYFYNFDEGLLLMVDNNPKIKPQEFETKHANETLILIGKYIYRDNNMQTKLTRLDAKPVRVNQPTSGK